MKLERGEAGGRKSDAAFRLENTLVWLADAPLFIDREQVAAFYDAVVRPEGVRGKTTVSLEKLRSHATKGEVGGEIEVSIASWISALLPFLDGKIKGTGAASHERGGSQTEGETVELFPIETPQRQLIQLTLHYLANQPKRLRVVSDPFQPGWCSAEYVATSPRALVFLDFPGQDRGPHATKFIPMAAEVGDGKVVTLYDQLHGKETVQLAYPERTSFDDREKYLGERRKYWEWFDQSFSPKQATEVVERLISGEGGRVRWINYRVPLPGQDPLHLNICGRGLYDTGTFAYSLIKRGFSHGLRLVGTLKSEPSINVLAIYEK